MSHFSKHFPYLIVKQISIFIDFTVADKTAKIHIENNSFLSSDIHV